MPCHSVHHRVYRLSLLIETDEVELLSGLIGADVMNEAFLIDGRVDEVMCTRRFGHIAEE